MGVEVYWLPHLGPWTDAVHGAVVTGMLIAGVFCGVSLAIRGYRCALQALAWAVRK